MKNINTGSSFEEYIRSIVVEIRRLLSLQAHVQGYRTSDCTVEWKKINSCGRSGRSISVRQNGEGHNAQMTFDRLVFYEMQSASPEALVKLADIRLAMVVEFLEHERSDLSGMLETMRGMLK